MTRGRNGHLGSLVILILVAWYSSRGSGFLPAPSVTLGRWTKNGRVRDGGWKVDEAGVAPTPAVCRRSVSALYMVSRRTGMGTQVVFIRHGMSTFNKLNIFTGWCDVPLAEEGKVEAYEAGKLLAAAGYRFDIAHSSVLKRACISLHRLLDGCGQPYVPITTNWKLNERHYGALQGRNKANLEEAMGPIVMEWRRGYATPPPPMLDTHPHWNLINRDTRYRGLMVPTTESLKDTGDRVMGYWEEEIVPQIKAGKRVLVVAHANTLRSLVKRLDGIDEESIKSLKIPTGEPFVYDFDRLMQPLGEPDHLGFRGRFVGDLMEGEKESAVDEYKRLEQACFDKWKDNPEEVPEECLCTPDYDGEDQASVGLDRYSVGYDLPRPATSTVAVGEEVVAGAPLVEVDDLLEDLPLVPPTPGGENADLGGSDLGGSEVGPTGSVARDTTRSSEHQEAGDRIPV
ncbi:unnamed protein product [Choristocarpus tenellus]